jgi:hypothetical protein
MSMKNDWLPDTSKAGAARSRLISCFLSQNTSVDGLL